MTRFTTSRNLRIQSTCLELFHGLQAPRRREVKRERDSDHGAEETPKASKKSLQLEWSVAYFGV
jgi:hypothetical protein